MAEEFEKDLDINPWVETVATEWPSNFINWAHLEANSSATPSAYDYIDRQRKLGLRGYRGGYRGTYRDCE